MHAEIPVWEPPVQSILPLPQVASRGQASSTQGPPSRARARARAREPESRSVARGASRLGERGRRSTLDLP